MYPALHAHLPYRETLVYLESYHRLHELASISIPGRVCLASFARRKEKHSPFPLLCVISRTQPARVRDYAPMGRFEYLIALLLCLVVTLPLEVFLRVGVYRQARRLLASLGCVGAVFVTWDLMGARLGHWDYNPAYVTGLRIFGLPIEEYLFFIVVPLCGILAYEAVRATLPDVSRWLADRWERLGKAVRR